MMRGLSFRTSSYPSPRRSIVPGAMFSTVMSAFLSSSLTRWSPRGDLRSSVSDFLFALNMWKYHGSSGAFPGSTRRAGSPVFGFSILTTSAPSHASASVHDGPASNWVKSTTRMPARQSRSWQVSLIADLLPQRGFMVHNRDPPRRSKTDAASHARSEIDGGGFGPGRLLRVARRKGYDGRHELDWHLDCCARA